ncbi:MAG: HdeD family acid-resistance protein [Caldilineaceae bacterium]
MAAATMDRNTHTDSPITPWWLVLITGISLIIIGLLLFARPVNTTLVLVQVMGWYWFFSGIMHIVKIFVDRRGWGWNLALGILGIGAGLYIINNPLIGTASVLAAIVLIVAFQAIVYGIVSLIAAFQGGGFGAGALGVISIVLGVILLGQPLISMAVLPWVVGTFMIAGGAVAIFAAFRQRRQMHA